MEKHLYYGNCIGTNFTGFPHSWGFGAFSLYVKAMRKPLHFPFDELYHRMGTGWIRSTHTVGKLWLPISQVPPIEWVFLHFPCYGKSMGKPMHFSYGEIYHRMGTGWEKSTHIWGKYEPQFLSFSPYNRFCCIFRCYGTSLEKPMHLPYAETYHRMEIGRKKATIPWGKYQY